ncbi:MAG: M28 family peptidase [Bacteroidia bacterium]
MRFFPIILLLSLLTLAGCGGCDDKKPSSTKVPKPARHVEVPDFNADTAFAYIEKQLSFGPRVPNSPEHARAAQYLSSELGRYADTTYMQTGSVRAFNGKSLNLKNIIGIFGPEKKRKILLCAHWDTRPFADQDADSLFNEPIPGANDGASGVAVLLEMARHFHEKQPDVGVVMIFFDAEDYGKPDQIPGPQTNSYALGSQYWARSVDKSRYIADYGILLDMVGGSDARFFREKYSMDYAPSIVKKVWRTASQLGHNGYFISLNGGGVVDDHYYINTLAQIPTINIVDFDNSRDKGFNDHWHTLDDDIENIDRNTLKAVGQTVIKVVYEEEGLGV